MGGKECANCGDRSIEWYEVIAPSEWVEYLHEKRGLETDTGEVRITVCGECYPDIDLLRQHQQWMGERDEEIETFLERIDLAAVELS